MESRTPVGEARLRRAVAGPLGGSLQRAPRTIDVGRLVRPWTLAVGVAVAVAAVIAWYLASPLFLRTHLVEETPVGLLPPADLARPPDTEDARSVGARIFSSGSFSDRDALHRGSGQALLARTAEGALVLRFEAFSVTNGPDLHVFLSRTERPATHDEVYDGVYVGKLKAPEGAFHYELPAQSDISGLRSVVVYCVPFRVIFTSAPLAPSGV